MAEHFIQTRMNIPLMPEIQANTNKYHANLAIFTRISSVIIKGKLLLNSNLYWGFNCLKVLEDQYQFSWLTNSIA
jgi:hypothetical protein